MVTPWKWSSPNGGAITEVKFVNACSAVLQELTKIKINREESRVLKLIINTNNDG